jgi:hypothetical protein
MEQSLLDINNSNAVKTTTRFKNKSDKISNGWVYHVGSQNGFDTSMVDINKIKKLANYDNQYITEFMSDAIGYVGTNSKNLLHLHALQEKITDMKTILEGKCVQFYSISE